MKCSAPTKITLERKSLYHVGTVKGRGIAAVPCGVCHNCRVNQARIWRNRILLEQSVHGNSCFVTLTYSDKHIPDPPHLKPNHLSKYIKRLRYYVEPHKIRYFGVGEYGSRSFRPHYHIALFGLDYYLNEPSIKKSWLYCDPDIGIHIGELNQESASYITGYVTKKILKKTKQHPVNYGKPDEFMRCSLGLGKEAALKIAKYTGENKHWPKKKILKSIQRGRSNYPLGRYLVRKCAEEMSIEEEMFLVNFWANQQINGTKTDREKPYKEKRGVM